MNGWLKFFLTDLKRVFSYRIEFWLGLFGNVASQFAVAYFVWKSIYTSRGAESLQGFSFGGLMAYYLIAPLVERTVQGGDWGQISREIYEGGLNRYLVYPVSFFGAKFMGHLAQAVLGFGQMGLLMVGLSISGCLESHLGLENCFAAAGVMACATLVQFALTACIEQLAFWVDNVWSLLVMSRMIVHLAGGALLPLAFFPQGLLGFFQFLPFRCFIDLPTRLLLGKSNWSEAIAGMGLSLIWAFGLAMVSHWLWRRGLLRYSGAGM